MPDTILPLISSDEEPINTYVWLDTSNKDTHFTGGVYQETENTDDLYEINNPYDDYGNYIGG